MQPFSSILAWKILWTDEPGRLQSLGSQRVRHDLATKAPTSTIYMTGIWQEWHFPFFLLLPSCLSVPSPFEHIQVGSFASKKAWWASLALSWVSTRLRRARDWSNMESNRPEDKTLNLGFAHFRIEFQLYDTLAMGTWAAFLFVFCFVLFYSYQYFEPLAIK